MNKCLNCGYEFEEDTIICPICMKIYCDKQYNNVEEIESLKGEKDVTIE